MVVTFTPAVKLACARRELGQRRSAYPIMVAAGKMTEDKAEREIGLMAAIVADYEFRSREQL